MTDGFVFWVNQLSIHTQPLIDELARRVPVAVVFCDQVAADLVEYGAAKAASDVSVWPIGQFLDDNDSFRAACRGRVHVFWGFGSYPAIALALRRVAAEFPDTTRLIFTEPWNPTGWKGFVRRALYVSRRRAIVPHIEGILTTGSLAASQFEYVANGRARIIPFGYTVDIEGSSPPGNAELSTEDEIVFVGSLDSRKNPLLLVEALDDDATPFKLRVYGKGPLLDELASHRLHLAGALYLNGVVPNAEVSRAMRRARLLVLTSVFDGWGAVVNESLAVGTPVLVSDTCGSAELARFAPGSGVFQSGDVDDLRRGLSQLATTSWGDDERANLIDWSQRCISPRAMADYLMAQVGAPAGRVGSTPPWMTQP